MCPTTFGTKEVIMTYSDNNYRSWFCVLNNPQDQFLNQTPQEIVKNIIELWVNNHSSRTCAVNYEIGDNGTPHCHMVLEDSSKVRFSAIKKLFPKAHIEPTRGNKEQAEAYILKKTPFEEKLHTVVVPAVFYGEIKAKQGTNKLFDSIQEMIDEGATPALIMDELGIASRRYETYIKKAFFRKSEKEAPLIRNLKAYWHMGESGSGKSHFYIDLCAIHGRDNIYRLSDYENGGLDDYCGQKILFMDEFKGNMRYQTLLNYLDIYTSQIHCRYTNSLTLWDEVHITSVFSPEEAWEIMVNHSERERDSFIQLVRRLSEVVFHWTDSYGNFQSFSLTASKYKNRKDIETLAYADFDIKQNKNGKAPFDEA